VQGDAAAGLVHPARRPEIHGPRLPHSGRALQRRRHLSGWHLLPRLLERNEVPSGRHARGVWTAGHFVPTVRRRRLLPGTRDGDRPWRHLSWRRHLPRGRLLQGLLERIAVPVRRCAAGMWNRWSRVRGLPGRHVLSPGGRDADGPQLHSPGRAMPRRGHLSQRQLLQRVLERDRLPGGRYGGGLWDRRRDVRDLRVGMRLLLRTGEQPLQRRPGPDLDRFLRAPVPRHLPARITILTDLLRLRGRRCHLQRSGRLQVVVQQGALCLFAISAPATPFLSFGYANTTRFDGDGRAARRERRPDPSGQ
jgi:hypothetical protein